MYEIGWEEDEKNIIIYSVGWETDKSKVKNLPDNKQKDMKNKHKFYKEHFLLITRALLHIHVSLSIKFQGKIFTSNKVIKV